jgi:hypothetical protein
LAEGNTHFVGFLVLCRGRNLVVVARFLIVGGASYFGRSNHLEERLNLAIGSDFKAGLSNLCGWAELQLKGRSFLVGEGRIYSWGPRFQQWWLYSFVKGPILDGRGCI